MAIQYEGQVMKAGSAVWEPLFAAQTASDVTIDTTGWPEGSTQIQVREIDSSDAAVSSWTTHDVVVAAAPVAPPAVERTSNPVRRLLVLH